MDVLLDTNVLLYAMSNDDRLGASAREMIEDPRIICHFSAVSVWEVVIKHGVNPGNVPVDGARFVTLCKQAGVRELPLTGNQAALSAEVVETGHKDPFDRMLLAQAKIKGYLFMTCDKVIMRYGFPFTIDGRV